MKGGGDPVPPRALRSPSVGMSQARAAAKQAAAPAVCPHACPVAIDCAHRIFGCMGVSSLIHELTEGHRAT